MPRIGRQLVADTRAVLIGTGVVLLILGFVFSTLVCGVGLLFILLGLVIWRREEDDTADYTAKASPGPLGVPRRPRSRRKSLVAIAAGAVLVAGFGGYLLFQPPPRDLLTGIQISAPDGSCWNGTVGSGASPDSTGVGGCRPASISLTCVSAMWAKVAKTTPGNWTLAVTGYRNGASLGTNSTSNELGVVQGVFAC